MQLRNSDHANSTARPAPPTRPELSEHFLLEQEVYRGLRDEHRKLIANAEGARAVATLDPMSRADREHRHVQHLRDKAETFLAERTLTARELVQAVELTDEAVVAHAPLVDAAKGRYDQARNAEIVRLARLLEPEHRAAVMQLARALESVSAAIESERAVRARLDALGIGSAPAVLPDCSSELNLGTFDEWSSRISEWRRKYHVLGVLA